MAEDKSEHKLSRRKFGVGLLTAAAAVAGGNLVGRLNEGGPDRKAKELEIPEGRSRIDTKEAIFVPFYERHDLGVSTEEYDEIKRIDGFLFENVLTPDELEYTTDLFAKSKPGDPFPDYASEIVHVLHDRNSVILFEATGLQPGTEVLASAVYAAESVGMGIFTLAESSRALINRFIKKKEPTVADSFRVAASIVGGTWAQGHLALIGLASKAETLVPREYDSDKIKTAIKWLNGVMTKTHPEDYRVLFRDLKVTRMLGELASYINQKKDLPKGKKPIIGYKMGIAHSGIDQLLVLQNFFGSEFILSLIRKFPSQTRQFLVEYNGGVEKFCTYMYIDNGEVLRHYDRDLAAALSNK